MGFRFRKSVNLGPLRINLSKSGVGYSVGSKFGRITQKADGTIRTTTTIPGAGVSHVNEISAKQVNAAQGGSPNNSGGSLFKPVLLSAVLICVLIFAIAGCVAQDDPQPSDAEPSPVVQEQQQEEAEPVDCTSITACFAEAFPDAEVVCNAKPDRPEFTITTALASDAQPEDWTQLMETFDASLADADAAAKDLKQKTAFGQLVAADGTILASGYNGKLQFDLFAKRAADQAEADRIAAEKAVQENQSTSSSTSSRTVYVTPTGSKYHYSSSCNGGSYSATTLDDAISRGLTPCKKCA